jgi:hypothetical protein
MTRDLRSLCATLFMLTLTITVNTATAADVSCCTATTLPDGSPPDDCISLAFPTPLTLPLTWNNGTVERFWDISLCDRRQPSLPTALLQEATALTTTAPNSVGPKALQRLRSCVNAAFISQMSSTSGCEVQFETMTGGLVQSADGSIQASIWSTDASRPFNAQVSVQCGPTARGAVVASGARPSTYFFNLVHPDACTPVAHHTSISLGDFLIGVLCLAALIPIAYRVSVNAFVHKYRGVRLLEPLPTLIARCRRPRRAGVLAHDDSDDNSRGDDTDRATTGDDAEDVRSDRSA